MVMSYRCLRHFLVNACFSTSWSCHTGVCGIPCSMHVLALAGHVIQVSALWHSVWHSLVDSCLSTAWSCHTGVCGIPWSMYVLALAGHVIQVSAAFLGQCMF